MSIIKITKQRPVFGSLEPWQFHAMLDMDGLRPLIDASIAAMPTTLDRVATKARLEYTTTFHRTDPLFDLLGPAIGLTETDIDRMWLVAGSL
jgi:hypothetical protein